jgi:hypothetical protein
LEGKKLKGSSECRVDVSFGPADGGDDFVPALVVSAARRRSLQRGNGNSGSGNGNGNAATTTVSTTASTATAAPAAAYGNGDGCPGDDQSDLNHKITRSTTAFFEIREAAWVLDAPAMPSVFRVRLVADTSSTNTDAQCLLHHLRVDVRAGMLTAEDAIAAFGPPSRTRASSADASATDDAKSGDGDDDVDGMAAGATTAVVVVVGVAVALAVVAARRRRGGGKVAPITAETASPMAAAPVAAPVALRQGVHMVVVAGSGVIEL